MKDDLEIGFVTPKNIANRASGSWLFEVILSALPDAMPKKYGNYEPLGMTHYGSGIGSLADSWANPFLWSRNLPRVRGSAWFGKGFRHSACQMTLESSKIDIDSTISFLKEICTGLEVDFGYAYLFSRDELADRTRYKRLMPFRRGVVTTDLMEGIPDIPSVMILGKPYVEMFGRETLLSSPAARIEELAGGEILVQVCSDCCASKDSFSEFDIQRERLKEHLGSEAFVEGYEAEVTCPEFRFKE